MLRTTVIEQLQGGKVNEVVCHMHKSVTDEEIESVICLAIPDVMKEDRGRFSPLEVKRAAHYRH